jgi:hypothetical protein
MGPSHVGYERARSKGEVRKPMESNKIQKCDPQMRRICV